MKKTILSVCGFAALLFLCTGCTTVYRDASASYLDAPPNFGATPYYTEYETGKERIDGIGRSSVVLWLFHSTDGKKCIVKSNPQLSIFSPLLDFFSPTQKAINNAKGSAVFNACEKSRADQILGATFEYTIRNYLFVAKVVCTVKGYPAYAKGIKMLDKQPVILNNWQKIEYVSPYGAVKDLSSKCAPAHLTLSK